MKCGNLRVRGSISLILIAVLLCPIVYGEVIYVDGNAKGLNNGTSWENAYTYLQEALADAKTAEKPVEIRVAEGIYRPDEGLVAIPEFDWRMSTFQLINGVSIKGGYASFDETDPNTRDIESFETILSGEIGFGRIEEVLVNSYNVVTGSGTDANAVLDGFTITGGRADGPRGPVYSNLCSGGGIYNYPGSPTIINCKLSNNHALDYGGGMYNYESNPILTNCTFSSNEAGKYGGGVYNFQSDPLLKVCTFENNRAETSGGGMYSRNNCNPKLNKCIFTGNSGYSGGGMFNGNSSPMIRDSIFSDNHVSFFGGGLCNSGESYPVLISCDITGNTAGATELAYSMGGGIYNGSRSHITLTNCRITGNKAGIVYGFGGGMCNRNSNHHSSATLINCTFADNSAPEGNAIACNSPDPNFPSTIEITNSILWNGGDEIWNNDSSIITITYSNVQGLTKNRYGIPIGGINKNPCFARHGFWDINETPDDPNDGLWVEGDYHLKSEYGRWDPNSESWVVDEVTSPCVDAGDPNNPVGDEPEPNGGRINMGAYGGTIEASKSVDIWWFETTQGVIVAEGLGIILPHEHIFTDLRGPGTRGYGQADTADVVRVMAPLLEEAKQKGVGLLIECSSIGVGRNVSILSEVSNVSGLPVVVPTGVYGRANFAPTEHRNMSEDELTELFISEIREGIEGSGIKAGFIKIATGGSNMTSLEEKFLRAAGHAALETGAAVASHTTTSSNVTRQVDILESIGPGIRFIWVHAQSVNNRSLYRQLAERGVFIEFDSLGWNPGQDSTFIAAIKELLAAGYGEQILLSHDAGWYQPGEQNGGSQMPYTYLIETFIPKLKDSGVDDETIRMITEINPIRAFGFSQDVNP